jgi:hypothetical protein
LLLCLDEVDNLGRLGELERAVSYLQGSGTQVLFSWQNMAQPLRTYGPDSPLLASIGTHVHYTPIDVATSEAVSRALGEETITSLSVTQGESRRNWFAWRSRSSSVQEAAMGQALLLPDEVRRWDEHWAIILSQGNPPVAARKLSTPPPALPVRVLERVGEHRTSLSLAAACLAGWFALTPLWRTTTPPLTRLASPTSPPVVLSAVGDPSPPPAQASPPAATSPPAVRSAMGTPPPPSKAPVWHLRTSNMSIIDEAGPRTIATFPSQELCRHELARQAAPRLEQLAKSQGNPWGPVPDSLRVEADMVSWQEAPFGKTRSLKMYCTDTPE